MARLLKSPSEIEIAYMNAIRGPKTFSATCEDYRAGASIDLEHDVTACEAERSKSRDILRPDSTGTLDGNASGPQ